MTTLREALDREQILEDRKRKRREKKEREFDAFDTLVHLGKEINRFEKGIPPISITFKQILGIKKIEPKVVEKTDEEAWKNLGYQIAPHDPKETGYIIKKAAYITKKKQMIENFLEAAQIKLIGIGHNPLHQNPNAYFVGGTGSAKTVRAKREVENRYIEGRRIFVIDPKGEWEHGLPVPQETEKEIKILEWNGESPRGFPVRVIPPRFDDRIVLHDAGVLAGVASLHSDNQKAQVAILLNTFNEQVVPTLDHEPRIGDFVEFATTYQDKEIEQESEDGKKGKKKKVSLPHIQRGLAKLKERYDSGLFAPVLEEMLTMPQEEIGVVSAGTVFRTDIYGILIEHWVKLFFNYLMTNTCPGCYETYTLNDMELGMQKCTKCGGHVASGICKKCAHRGFERAPIDGKCLNCGRDVVRVIPTDIVLEELQAGSSKNPTLLGEISEIMSLNRVMGGGCGIIGITQSPTVFKSGGSGQNPIYTNIGMLSFAGAISGRADKGVLREGFGIEYGTENTDEDKIQIIKYSDTKMGLKVCSILPPRSYHPMFSGFDKRRLNV
jgi:hypothetical protein